MIRLLPVFILFLFSCGEVRIQPQSGPETTVPDTTAKEKVKKVNRIYFDADFDSVDTILTEFPGEKPKQIVSNNEYSSTLGFEMNIRDMPVSNDIILKKVNGQILPLGFTTEQFLSKLFAPEIHYTFDQEYTDSIPVSWWTCKNCKTDTIPYFGGIELGDVFPGAEINTSFVSGDYRFSLGKRNYRFTSFVSYPNEFSVSFCGRFSGGVMGYALFEETADASKLLDLNYQVGSFGNYNQPSDPEIRIAFDQLFLIYECTNGGAGGPYTSINEVWQFDGAEFKLLTKEDFLTLNNSGIGNWETHTHFYQDSLTKKIGIKFITTGWFTGNGEGELEDYIDYFDEVSRDFLLAVKDCDITRRPFEFTMERTRIFENGRTLKTQKFKSEKLKGEWITEYINE